MGALMQKHQAENDELADVLDANAEVITIRMKDLDEAMQDLFRSAGGSKDLIDKEIQPSDPKRGHVRVHESVAGRIVLHVYEPVHVREHEVARLRGQVRLEDTVNIGSVSKNLHGGRFKLQLIIVFRSRTWS